MTPIEHLAVSVVSIVTAHSILVTAELHAGIDLARQLVSNQMPTCDGVPVVTREERELIRQAHEVLTTRYQRLSDVASIFA